MPSTRIAVGRIASRWLGLCLVCFFGLQLTAHAQTLVIDSLDGEVTQHEVDTFISYVSAITPIPHSQWDCGGCGANHNYLADGTAGLTLEAMNDLYAVTGDIPSQSAQHTQLLNLAVAWTDTWLIYRNDLPLGEHRVMWTGNIDPVWPPNAPTADASTYAESEVGDTVGHMAYTAYNILKTPSIWNNTVPDGDPNHFGATYLERAKTYVSILEYTVGNYFTKYFIDPNTLLITRPSVSLGYLSSFHNVNAWNVQMMLLNAYQRLGQAHEILGDNPALATMYKTIVKNATNAFVQNARANTAPDGTAIYNWGYGNMGDVLNRVTGEDTGHGQYDIWGLTRAYRDGYTDATAQQMKTYADTLVHEIYGGPSVYYEYVDRSNGATSKNYLYPAWIFLTPYNTAIYKPAAEAAIQAGGRQTQSTIMTSTILWAKHWIAMHPAAGDFSLSIPSGSLSVKAGQTGSKAITIISTAGFSQPVMLSCSGAPSGATCTVSPSTVTPNGSSVVAQVSITSTAATAGLIAPTDARQTPLSASAAMRNPVFLAMLLTVPMITAASARRYRCLPAPALLGTTMLLLVLGVGIGCGGGGRNTGSPGASSPVTTPTGSGGPPVGTYPLTITASSGSQTRSATLNLVVN